MSETNSAVSRADLDQAKRIVIKVGSSLLTSLQTGLERNKIQSYCAEIARLMSLGKEVILVSSGSIAEGGSKSNQFRSVSSPNGCHAPSTDAYSGALPLK